jgi:hypothetical protein
MTEAEFSQHQKDGNVEVIQPTQPPAEPSPPQVNDEYQLFLETLRRPKTHLTEAPSFLPKNFLEQIQFVDDGADQYLALYINGAWYSFPGTLIP